MSKDTSQAGGPSPRKAGSPVLNVGLAAIAAVAAFAAVYVIAGSPDNGSRALKPLTAPPPAAKSGNHPLSTGAMTTFVFKPEREALPDIGFLDGDGKAVSLKTFRGKTVLLNLWATWCAPCRAEMGSLDNLQKALGSDTFEVVALAVDKSGIEGARKFFGENKIGALKLYADPTARIGTDLRVLGMPTSILIDKEGREIGRLIGPADWEGEDAKRLIEAQK
jgi:thiol-disulfide isomerase/thioredoxin